MRQCGNEIQNPVLGPDFFVLRIRVLRNFVRTLIIFGTMCALMSPNITDNNSRKIYPKSENMKKLILALVVITIVASSCSKSVSPSEAASGRYKSCRAVR